MNPFYVLYLVALVAIVASMVATLFIVGWKVFFSVLLGTVIVTGLLVIVEEWREKRG